MQSWTHQRPFCRRVHVFTSNLDAEQSAALFLNRGDGTFEDRTESAGLAEPKGARERERLEQLTRERADLQRKLQALGPSPSAKMG